MAAQAFLLQECKNVEQLLDETLRHEYGLDGSQDFYDECVTRLKFIERQLSTATDAASLTNWGNELNALTKLICRIERSSLGEYSWPFVDELKKIASAICIEASLSGDPSKIYVLADGGLDTYSMFPEPKRPSHRRRLLLTIVFPKTLKHFVLLHSILGHELGHAIWRCSKHEQTIKTNVLAKFAGVPGIFADRNATLDHIYSPGAPPEVKALLSLMATQGGIQQANFFSWANWDLWIEEILCDLFGLTTFGPSFVAAQCELLPSINPQIAVFGNAHPSSAWRINLILRGAKMLGYGVLPPKGNPAREAVEAFWNKMNSTRSADPWYDVLTDAQLHDALNGIKGLLHDHDPSGYPHPDAAVLGQLVSSLRSGIPPVGFALKRDGSAELVQRDFRQILYAGWITSALPGALPFEKLNRLCEHGIMQQRAIDIHLTGG